MEGIHDIDKEFQKIFGEENGEEETQKEISKIKDMQEALQKG